MTSEEYRAKYGDTFVMGVDRAVTDGLQKEGFTCRRDAIRKEGNVITPQHFVISKELKPMPRWRAEQNPEFKQVIPYVVLEHQPTGRVFMTMRLGGDERLQGQCSIGLGGHIDEGESVMDCLYRELLEEVGLEREEIEDTAFCGFIYSEATEVDSVHVGMVFRAFTKRETISCLEKDKLNGDWMNKQQLRKLRETGHMETWSVIAYDALMGEEDD